MYCRLKWRDILGASVICVNCFESSKHALQNSYQAYPGLLSSRCNEVIHAPVLHSVGGITTNHAPCEGPGLKAASLPSGVHKHTSANSPRLFCQGLQASMLSCYSSDSGWRVSRLQTVTPTMTPNLNPHSTSNSKTQKSRPRHLSDPETGSLVLGI